jgi:hypothetical protein
MRFSLTNWVRSWSMSAPLSDGAADASYIGLSLSVVPLEELWADRDEFLRGKHAASRALTNICAIS